MFYVLYKRGRKSMQNNASTKANAYSSISFVGLQNAQTLVPKPDRAE